MNGIDYGPWGGRWLDEDRLSLTDYAPITHASWPIAGPLAYALAGVPPERFLVIKTGRELLRKDKAEGEYTLIRHGAGMMPAELCDVADPLDSQYPASDCPLPEGRRYWAEMNTACGLRKTMGPYGGSFWRVIDPPPEVPATMYRDVDYGTIELLSNGRLRYRGERGAQLTLARTDRGADTVCKKQ